MTDDYKKQISTRIKDSINDWLDKLKAEHSNLLLTKQWNVLWPKGFKAGQIVIPVVTGSKKGKHLVGEIQFLLPDNLELDYDAVELVLKNEPFKIQKAKAKTAIPVPLDEPIDVLNNLVLGVNEFLNNLNLNIPATQTTIPTLKQQPSRVTPTISANPAMLGAAPPLGDGDVENVRDQMLRSQYLPEWFKTIRNKEIWDTLLSKLAEGLIHYQQKIGHTVDLEEYFRMYSEHLKEAGKLHNYCKYLSKPISLDSSGHCQESYCSKKPYHSTCSHATLKFGQQE
ncbi:MAG: hypothetical protein ISR95_00265 [Candidatus Marinimicrobia bacterium]|nr:hypothetical protein [Candidatus Neomarinimicrobiota bacterium]MBL7046064.1 hypothetical protein [Candidatus Neomarinimicrobiota bacterium]